MINWLEVLEPYVYVFLIKVAVRRYGTMQLVTLWSQVSSIKDRPMCLSRSDTQMCHISNGPLVMGFHKKSMPCSLLSGFPGTEPYELHTIYPQMQLNIFQALRPRRMLKRIYLRKKNSLLQRMLQLNWRGFSTITIGLN